MTYKKITPNTCSSLSEILACRHVIKQLSIRDIKVRYQTTALGYIWAIVNPLTQAGLYIFVFSMLVRVSTAEYDASYAAVLLVAFVLWNGFSNAVEGASNSLLFNSHLITKVYFPRIALPIAAALSTFIEFVIGFIVTIGLLLYFNEIQVSYNIFLLFLLGLFFIIGGTGIGMIFSLFKIRLPDFRHLQPLIMQILFFSSPIVYTSALIPLEYVNIYQYNPLANLIELGRSLIFEIPIIFSTVHIASLLFMVAIFVVASVIFNLRERKDVDMSL